MPDIVELDYNPWIECLSCFLSTNSASLAAGQFRQTSPALGFMQANSQSHSSSSNSKIALVLFFLLVIGLSYFISASTTERAFKRGDDRFMELFDSGVYLNSAKAILRVNQGKKRSNGHASQSQIKELADMLIVDGPVLPLIAARTILLAQSFNLSVLNALSMMESLVQSLAAGLVFILAWRATGRKSLALAAGLLWGLYPPAIIATQRLVTENLCAMLLLAIILCLDVALKSKSKRVGYMLAPAYAGFFFALLLLTKPVLIFCVLMALAFLFFCLRGKRAVIGITAFALATVVTMLPFWLFTREATGKIVFMPQRYPVLNALVTNSLVTDGFHGLPTPQASAQASSQNSVAGVELALFLEDPLGHTDLNIRKLARIFAEPWNDFRRTAVFLNALSIRFVHQLLAAFVLGAMALGLAATVKSLQLAPQKGSSNPFAAGLPTAAMLFLASLGHLIYAGFEGIPRYGFSATPLLLVLLFWAVMVIAQVSVSKLTVLGLALPPLLMALLSNFFTVQSTLGWLGSPGMAALVIGIAYALLMACFLLSVLKARVELYLNAPLVKAGAAIVFLVYISTTTLSLFRESKEAEIATRISGPAVAMREIIFPRQSDASNTAQWALLLVDASKEAEQAHISINGHRIRETPKNVYHYYQQKFDLLAFLEEMAKDINVKFEDIRHWRAVPVPVEYLNSEGKNQIRISSPSGAPLTVYGDYKNASADEVSALPSYEYVSHSRIFVNSRSLDWRPRVKFTAPAKGSSWMEIDEPKYPVAAKTDLSPAPGEQPGQWRLLLALGYSDGDKSFKSETKCMPLSSFNFKDTTNRELKIADKKAFLTLNTACHADYLLMPQKATTHVLVELKGKGQAVDGDRKQAVIAVRLNGTSTYGDGLIYFDCKGQLKPETLRFPGSAQVVTFKKGEDSEFQINAVYPINAVRGRGHHLTMEVLPVSEGTALTIKEAELSVKELSWPDLGQKSVFVY